MKERLKLVVNWIIHSQRVRKAFVVTITVILVSYIAWKGYNGLILLRTRRMEWGYFFLSILSGMMAYVSYTFLWHFLLKSLSNIDLKTTFKVNLLGSYFSFSLNPSLGNLIKSKYVGGDYFKALAITTLAVSIELGIGSVLAFIHGDLRVLPLLLFITAGIFFPHQTYRAVVTPIKLLKKENWAKRFFEGWIRGLSNHRRMLLASLAALCEISFNAITLFLVARTFGISVTFKGAVLAFVYSTFLSGVVGTPGGVGVNELGVMLAIGDTHLTAVVAFAYKFVTQYFYALLGALTFYEMSKK